MLTSRTPLPRRRALGLNHSWRGAVCAETRAPACVTNVLHGMALWEIARGSPPALLLRLSPLGWTSPLPSRMPWLLGRQVPSWPVSPPH